MLSFKIVTKENKENIKDALSQELSSSEREELSEIIDSIDLEDGDVEYAVTVSSGCALFRIFDFGRYLFVFPIELSDTSNPKGAVDEINEYATFEEIERVFVDVPPESLPVFSGFRHLDVDADGREASVYRVRIKTELDLLSEIPSFDGERVKLNALTEADIPDYARLSKDENVNKYWGYSYSDDVENPPDEYFYENAVREFSANTSCAFAIRADGKFVGEAILYSFDGKGGADIAIRILSEYQRRGYGSEALKALSEIAGKIGLTLLRAKIKTENSPSIALFRKYAEFISGENDIQQFEIEVGC